MKVNAINKTPKLYVLVGVPGSGKSTWVNSQAWAKDCEVVSTDSFVEQEAIRTSKTYSDVFNDYMPTAVRLMTEQVLRAKSEKRDIVWDQTSTTISSRTRKFRMLPEYYAIAVVFSTPSTEELAKRLAQRPGKIIPDYVIRDMVAFFEKPSEAEGFKEIWYVN